MSMRARTLIRDDRGMSLVFVGLGLMGFVAATMLAIDVGMLMTSRAQAQTSADAGAHAGAVALAFDDYNDRSSTGPAVTHAVREAQANLVMGGAVEVPVADIEWPPNPDLPAGTLTNRIRVHVYRDAAHDNPMGTFIARLFGMNTVDISAVATAEASPANAESCVLPFMIPDRWSERTSPPFNAITSEFDYYRNSRGGVPLANPDVYVPANLDGYTGYNPVLDKGTEIRLKGDNFSKPSPSIYQPITLPNNGTGARQYEEAIANCVQATFEWDQPVTVEPGNMVGPTKHGVDRLIARDPSAYWDEDQNCPARAGRCISSSPRIRPIPLYDPYYYETGKQTGRNADFKVANFLGVFVEPMEGNEVVARICPIAGKIGEGGGPIPANAFPYVIRIIE